MEAGFFGDKERQKNIYETFLGKPGHYSVGNTSATGILKEINFDEGYLAVQPSLVGCGENRVRIEKENPTIISLERGNPISMRPLREGDLQGILEEREASEEFRKSKEGQTPVKIII